MSILISWAVLTAGFMAAAYLLPGFKVRGLGGAIGVAAAFGLLNWAIGWLLFGILVVGTLGLAYLLGFLTRLVVNTILLKLVDALTDALDIKGWGPAVLGALVISAVASLAQYLLR